MADSVGKGEDIRGKVQHTQEEIDAFNERTETIGDYAQLVEMAIQDTQEEALAHPGKTGPMRELGMRFFWLTGLLTALVVGLILVVAAFYATGTDFTELLGGGETDTPATGEAVDSGSDESDGVAGEADSGSTTGASAATGAGDGATEVANPALDPHVLDLAVQIADQMAAYNAAARADDKKAAYEIAMAIKPLMTEYIQGGGDLQMPDFSEAHDEWLRAANSYVSGDTGAISEAEAAYDKAARLLSVYLAASKSAP